MYIVSCRMVVHIPRMEDSRQIEGLEVLSPSRGDVGSWRLSKPGSLASRPEPLLRRSDVARLLACSSETVYAWAASGYLPSVRLGRLVRFKAGGCKAAC